MIEGDNLHIEDLAQKYDIFLMDMDGVLYAGGDVIEGAFEGLKYLYDQGKKIYFISNSSSSGQISYAQKLQTLGFPIKIDPSVFYVSAYTTAVYLHEKHPNIKKVFAIGMKGVRDELERVGVEVVMGDKMEICTQNIKSKIDIEEDIEGVICGCDSNFTYYKLLYATLCVQKGAMLVGTNPDAYDQIGKNRYPGNGGLVKAIEVATGVKAIMLGKPYTIVTDTLMLKENLPLSSKQKMLIIGDRLDTDIELGVNSGIDTLCVYTGCTKEEDLAIIREEHKNGVKDHSHILPTYAFPRFGYFKHNHQLY